MTLSRLVMPVLLVLRLASLDTARAAEPIRIYAAGSLRGVMTALIAGSGLPADAVAPPVFGPAGALRQRLEAGETADLFASADLAQPRHLAQEHGAEVMPFARNRMCVLARRSLDLTAGTLLDRLLSPQLRLATSTPGADPGGDYALAVFARAEALHPGAEALLSGKAQHLLGGPASMAPSEAQSPAANPAVAILLGNRADALLYYCSGAAAASREAPALVAIPLPPALEVGPIYGLALLSDRPEAARLALFIVSERGQAILAQGGLLPLLTAR